MTNLAVAVFLCYRPKTFRTPSFAASRKPSHICVDNDPRSKEMSWLPCSTTRHRLRAIQGLITSWLRLGFRRRAAHIQFKPQQSIAGEDVRPWPPNCFQDVVFITLSFQFGRDRGSGAKVNPTSLRAATLKPGVRPSRAAILVK